MWLIALKSKGCPKFGTIPGQYNWDVPYAPGTSQMQLGCPKYNWDVPWLWDCPMGQSQNVWHVTGIWGPYNETISSWLMGQGGTFMYIFMLRRQALLLDTSCDVNIIWEAKIEVQHYSAIVFTKNKVIENQTITLHVFDKKPKRV